jgi:probable HAF family extracellular repeat protein
LTFATAINDVGQIVGYGTNPQGVRSAFILAPASVPEPATYSMAALGAVLIGAVSRRRKKIG